MNDSALTLDEPRRLILAWIADHPGHSLKSLSLAIGRNHSYLQQFIRTKTPINLPENDREALAEILRIDERRLRGASSRKATRGGVSVAPNAQISGSVQLDTFIPVYGQAVGGKDGKFVLNGNKVADVLAPPVLAGVRDAYAVYVVGHSMEPRYLAGEAVYVNPRMPVRQRDFVVVQLRPEEDGEPPSAYIKRFISMDSNVLKLEQFSPRKVLKFPADQVVTIHRIVMSGDG